MSGYSSCVHDHDWRREESARHVVGADTELVLGFVMAELNPDCLIPALLELMVHVFLRLLLLDADDFKGFAPQPQQRLKERQNPGPYSIKEFFSSTRLGFPRIPLMIRNPGKVLFPQNAFISEFCMKKKADFDSRSPRVRICLEQR